jgi:hypothetical protein
MKLYYVSTDRGCCLRSASTASAAKRSVANDVGINNVRDVRLATRKDVEWVRGMGGYVPANASMPP